ncbi:Rrf2 family transcriptional regulator [Variovorax sp. J22P240]|uniref:RrF2 family transcriptional regulator n=1 Tax=unclassified Variovorax TaxID=663243 RepID=UPI00257747CF|nr:MULTISPECIES: Rrf2 family transcriptional regulator [unclassified Variovorax]MDM0001121.1 Rrf2 family transcriptional regulator [Variovorax sp. J22P240]MDM0049792.1 Rrf2 family transcriptional regulator [Variovorax sp. J22R115]
MRLTLFTDYSLRVLLVLATRTESLVTIADLTQAYGISQAHLMKVTHILGKTGWVETVRGRNGGMRLAMHPSKIKIGTVVRQLESDFAVVECFGAGNQCVLTGGCELASVLARATQAFLDELDRYSLADLANASPALLGLPLWQEVTWRSKVKDPTVAIVPGKTDELLRHSPGKLPARKRARAA